MSIFDRLRHELVDIVQWLDASQDTMVYRFERWQNEIKYGAKLVVREGQAAVFVNEGQIADVFGPGTYTLDTRNLPILATLKGWKYGFESPFKAEVYYCSMRQFTNLKWGTMNPLMMRDAEFGPVRLRAFGTYATRIKTPATLIRQIVGTDGHFTADQITDQLRNIIVSRFGDILGESKIPVLDLASNYNELSEFLTNQIQPEFDQYGLELTKLLVENISLPPAVEEAMDKRTSMGIVGNLDAYTRFNLANAIPDAAKNPGGLAAAGAGLGMGMALGGTMHSALQTPMQAAVAPPGSLPPPLPSPPPPVQYHAAIAGQAAGPFDLATIEEHITAGRVLPETLVWKPGLAAWKPAQSVAELKSIFTAKPPPLPE